MSRWIKASGARNMKRAGAGTRNPKYRSQEFWRAAITPPAMGAGASIGEGDSAPTFFSRQMRGC